MPLIVPKKTRPLAQVGDDSADAAVVKFQTEAPLVSFRAYKPHGVELPCCIVPMKTMSSVTEGDEKIPVPTGATNCHLTRPVHSSNA